jgi:hypothetical protein
MNTLVSHLERRDLHMLAQTSLMDINPDAWEGATVDNVMMRPGRLLPLVGSLISGAGNALRGGRGAVPDGAWCRLPSHPAVGRVVKEDP